MLTIRPYHPSDDDALIRLERLSPRGFPNPFVHFRRRFVDRAELYPQALTLVGEVAGEIAAVSSIILKPVLVGQQYLKIAYSFDSRVAPHFRKQGIGHAIIEEKLAWAQEMGAEGVYSLVVATNYQSLGMVEKSGYRKSRMVMYLQYQPSPMLLPLQGQPFSSTTPTDHAMIQACYANHDLYIPDMAEQVSQSDLGYQRWNISDDQDRCVGLSVFDQAQVYVQIPAEAPWPKTEAEIERLGHTWQIFDVVGLPQADLMQQLFHLVREEAVMQNVNKLIWLVDRQVNVPHFVLDEASLQIDYWLMYKAFGSYDPAQSPCIYLDPRDI